MGVASEDTSLENQAGLRQMSSASDLEVEAVMPIDYQTDDVPAQSVQSATLSGLRAQRVPAPSVKRLERVIAPKELIKLVLMSLLAAYGFGLLGLGALTMMFFLSHAGVGRDYPSSHGISGMESSRLGGVAISITLLFYALSLSASEGIVFTYTAQHGAAALAIGFCALLGLVEDVYPDSLAPRLRLILKMCLFAGLLIFWPQLAPSQLGVPGLDSLLSVPFISACLTVIFCVGFVNAVNMSDGANGLVPGIAAAALWIFAMHYGRMIEVSLLFGCGIFLIFNVISGRFFLGDMGSYGLGALLAIYGLFSYSAGDFSAAFLAALFGYPCIDFIFSISRRLRAGRSAFAADNDHLHNRLHARLKQVIKSRVIANSMTGLLISGGSAGVVLCGYSMAWWPPTSNQWIYLFGLQIVAYLLVFSVTGGKKSKA